MIVQGSGPRPGAKEIRYRQRESRTGTGPRLSMVMKEIEVAASAKETKSREVRRRFLLFQIVTSLRPTRVNTKLTAAVMAASQIAKVGPAPALCSMEAEKYMTVLIPANCCTA